MNKEIRLMPTEIIPSEESQDLFQNAQQAIQGSIRRGYLNVLYTGNKFKLLHILGRSYSDPTFLAEAVQANDIPISHIDQLGDPFKLIVARNATGVVDVAKELPGLVHLYYPQADSLPIYVYTKAHDFQWRLSKRRPSAIVLTKNNLVTVQQAA